jgi:hypothetical protein
MRMEIRELFHHIEGHGTFNDGKPNLPGMGSRRV